MVKKFLFSCSKEVPSKVPFTPVAFECALATRVDFKIDYNMEKEGEKKKGSNFIQLSQLC